MLTHFFFLFPWLSYGSLQFPKVCGLEGYPVLEIFVHLCFCLDMEEVGLQFPHSLAYLAPLEWLAPSIGAQHLAIKSLYLWLGKWDLPQSLTFLVLYHVLNMKYFPLGFWLEALFWKVAECLGGGTSLEEVGHYWWILKFYNWALLPVHSLLPDWVQCGLLPFTLASVLLMP